MTTNVLACFSKSHHQRVHDHVSFDLQRHPATVFTVHAFIENPEELTRKADIVISAARVTNLVRKHWLKHGSVVIDVGTNPVENESREHAYYFTGDVCYEEALQMVLVITPVPGGVGPVTVAMHLSNTLDSCNLRSRWCPLCRILCQWTCWQCIFLVDLFYLILELNMELCRSGKYE